jgi:FG-GAP repeat
VGRRATRVSVTVVLLGVCALAFAPSAAALDLAATPHVIIDQSAPQPDHVGWSVSAAGDVNGDGAPDVVVGAPEPFGSEPGSAYVVFGRAAPGTIDVSALGTEGFRIVGASAADYLGYSVSGAGDVNGDGLDDVIVGALTADNNGRPESGSAYVVFGSPSPVTVNLNALGGRGFRIDGAASGDALSRFVARFAVAGAGDVNGDGLADVAVVTGYSDNNGRADSGSGYVVFGTRSAEAVDLAALGGRGFRIDGDGDEALAAIAGAGDVNGDGYADLVLGAPNETHGTASVPGTGFVVFGMSSTNTVDLASLGARGFRIGGVAPGDSTGYSVAGAGDVNRDGLADVILGAAGADNNGRFQSGSAYVVFGSDSTEPVEVTTLGRRGFRIDGAAKDDGFAYSVSGIGDINRDGLDDLIVGAPVIGAEIYGSAFVVLGQASSRPIDLALGTSGFRIDASAGEWSGWSVSGAGDWNGDGRPDVIVGSPENNFNTRSGLAHVVFTPSCRKIPPGRGATPRKRPPCNVQ